jgi:hypothetical protein
MHVFEVTPDVPDHHVTRGKVSGGVARLKKPLGHDAGSRSQL